jgi:hypothetical protein
VVTERAAADLRRAKAEGEQVATELEEAKRKLTAADHFIARKEREFTESRGQIMGELEDLRERARRTPAAAPAGGDSLELLGLRDEVRALRRAAAARPTEFVDVDTGAVVQMAAGENLIRPADTIPLVMEAMSFDLWLPCALNDARAMLGELRAQFKVLEASDTVLSHQFKLMTLWMAAAMDSGVKRDSDLLRLGRTLHEDMLLTHGALHLKVPRLTFRKEAEKAAEDVDNGDDPTAKVMKRLAAASAAQAVAERAKKAAPKKASPKRSTARSQSPRARPATTTGGCWKCGVAGHKAVDCTAKNQGPGARQRKP